MTTKQLKGFVPNAPATNDDLKYEQESLQEELLERTRLAMGHPLYITNTYYGIVASTDPVAEFEGSSSPLVVSADTGSLTISVNPGYAVTKSGFRIHIESFLSAQGLASADIGVVNVVTLKYQTANPSTMSTSDFGRPTWRRRVQPEDENVLTVYTLDQWNALDTEDQDDHVVLAFVTPQTGSSGSKVLSVDLGQSNYNWNRPWFSVQDLEHRSKVGSGTVTEKNPHGNNFSDFNAGEFTLPQLINKVGVIASKPTDVAHVPGRLCTTVLPIGSQKIDTTGTYGSGVGAVYYELPFYPLRLGRVYHTADDGQEFAFRIYSRTNIIVQYGDNSVVPTGEITVKATKSLTLEPQTTSPPNTQMTLGAIQPYDLALADGVAYTSNDNVTLTDSMGDAGPIPLFYNFYFQAGSIVKNPQVLLCRTLLSAIGSGVTPTASQFGKGRILVALDKAAAGASLSVKIRVSGKDEDGVATSEVFTFDSNWSQGPTVPNCAPPINQFYRGDIYFSSVTSITLDEAFNAGADAAIQVWNVMHTSKTDELRGAILVAWTTWDGVKLCSVKDARQVVPDLQSFIPDKLFNGLGQAIDEREDPAALFQRRVVLVESFETPQYGDLVEPSWSDWLQSEGIHSNPTEDGHPGLAGYYRSRAIGKLGGAVGFASQIQIRFVPGGQNINERVSYTNPFPVVEISEQIDATTWASWIPLVPTAFYGTTTGPYEWFYFPWLALQTGESQSFRIRIRNGYGLKGMIVTEDIT